MDTLITFVEVEGFLKNPPSLAPTRLRVLCRHMIDVLRQLSCPQSAIHGWAGLIMHPTMYAMIEIIPFQVQHDPGDVPTLPTFAVPALIKITKRLFKRDKTYFRLYKNIYHACYKMLNNNIANEFKMSPDPCLIDWNSTMSIQEILNQLELAHSHPTGHELLQNNALFCLPFHSTETPECLFCCIKQCQEIQVIANNPYTLMQLMTNTVQLLMALGIFPARESKDWEAMPNKTYTSLKVLIHGAMRGVL
jgi:hypothetical protein